MSSEQGVWRGQVPAIHSKSFPPVISPTCTPSLAVESDELQLLHWKVVTSTGIDFDARQHHRQLQVLDVGRLT